MWKNADQILLLKRATAFLFTFSVRIAAIKHVSLVSIQNCLLPGGKTDRICNNEDQKCTKKVKKNLTNVEHEDYKSCKCLPECNHINYYFENFHERFTVENQSKLEEHTAALIRFEDDEFVAYKKYESFGSVGLLSNLGGLLGLFLGVSVLSIIETIYFFTLRLFNDIWCKAKIRK